MKRLTILAAVAAVGTLASCQKGGFDNGMSVNTVSRTYPADVERVWQSLTATMKELDLNVTASPHDALGGQVTANRATGERVFVRVRSMDPSNTQVDVAVDPADRNLAQIVQDRLAERLGGEVPGAPAGGVGAGSSVEGVYDSPLDECVAAAEQAMKALNLPVEARERHDIWASVRSRALEAVPVQITMRRTPKDETSVSFMVGSSPSGENQAIAERLKREFEGSLKQKP